MVLMNTRLARHAQSRGSSLALCFGLALALSTTATVPAAAQAPAAKSSPAKSSLSSAAQDEEDDEKEDDKADPGKGGKDAEERLVRRRERLEQGAKRLRDRAADLRKRIAAGETAAPQPANSKRPPRSLQEQAERFEKQAERMEARSKGLSVDAASGGAERSPEYARQRRHQLRRAHLNRRWGGPTLRDPEAVAEFKTHSERVARLKRIRSLAMEKGKDDPLAKRAKDLLTKEEDRHEQHMKAIQARVAPEAAGAAPAVATPTPGTTPTTAPAATEEAK